ncbi:GNAT family N-acetyltransferase [Tepidibacter hydrothermalis]|uniref:N-acetyltransferase n=1 Tax=Tepidibacter hydrothermalis TaxID=3036126 RepID=A0ABY8EJB2_9FIRM|nr:N-acetyltransferase [Tepidibacter hydrothermalis]WFD11869.1 N-acetyltransferase [Tepidibacter hydrothermalis]
MNISKLTIRQEQKDDHKQVYNVAKKAFENAEHTDSDEHNLIERLRYAKEFVPKLSLVAELEGKIVGHILFTEIKIGKKIGLSLAPVSVDPKYQSGGIGSNLIIKGHKIAKNLGYEIVVVLGHEKYYPRFGYVKASNYGIKAPFEVPDENFMVLELKENALNEIKGIVEYSSKFFNE